MTLDIQKYADADRAQYSADWGDYISFASHMRKHADERGLDLLLVDTGDRVDGNGLYDASTPKGAYTYDIFKQQHIDIICTGNHELYQADAALREYTKTVPNFKGNYLASNLDIIDPTSGKRVPLTRRYRKFTTKNQGIRVLAFGFLFDFTGNANNTFVQRVEDTIKEVWFQQAIRQDVDIFVIIGHIPLRSPEYQALYSAIRVLKPDIPIQFFGGHSHIRDFMSYDPKAYALESGRYMETIGWMSIDGISVGSKKNQDKPTSSMKFERRYIDNNLFGYHHHTGLNESTFPTTHGLSVSKSIQKARKALDLDQTFGCAPQDYWLNRAEYPSNSSLFSWLENEVLPGVVNGENRSKVPRLAIINTGGVRFDIFKGRFTKDTKLILCPFDNQLKYIKDVPYAAAKGVLPLINAGGPVFLESGLQSWVLGPPEQISGREEFDAESEQTTYHLNSQMQLGPVRGKTPQLIPGYTTKDDGGDDGDDTLHSPISYYRVPNCIQSTIAFPDNGDPEKVDLVFLDFIQPWVMLALLYLGQRFNQTDVMPYREGEGFTVLLEEWVKEHWKGTC